MCACVCVCVCSTNGTLVVYGNMSSKPHSVSVEALVLKNLTVRGFNLEQ